MTFFKNDKLMMIEGEKGRGGGEEGEGGEGLAKYYILLDNFCLKEPLVLKISMGIFFDSLD